MQEYNINRQRLLETFLELLTFNAPSRHEGVIARHVTEVMQDLGAEVTVDDAGNALGGETGNIIVRVPGTIPGPALLFCAHLDTVAPTEGLNVRRDDGIMSSEGTTILGADDRAGVAAIIEMVRILQEYEIAHPPLEIVFTVAEEIGVMGSMMLDYAQLTAQYGFVPDSTGDVGKIITRAPAQKHLHVVITGKAAHAGMAPEQGISAITIASRAIARMQQGRIDEETTANIGTIQGGCATNIIPEAVTIEGEARSRDPKKLDEQVAHMRACFLEEAERAGGKAEVEISDVFPAFYLDENSPAVQWAKDALTEVGIVPTVTATGGGSDANFINDHGIQTVILSAGYHNPHCCDEYLEEEQLLLLAEWLVQIVKRASA